MENHDNVTEIDIAPPAQAPMVEREEDSTLSTLGNRGVQRMLEDGVLPSGGSAGGMLDEAVARAISDRQGRGRRLPDDVREQMEPRVGASLDGVNIHTGADADDLNKEVGAKAFTAGDDVFFSSGKFDPSTSSGRELLAHELTHVAQQREGTSGLEPGHVSDPSDHAEREASDVGRAAASDVASGGSVAGGASPAPGVAREKDEELEEEVQTSPDPSLQREVDDEEEDDRA